MIVLTIEEILSRINREQNLKLDASEITHTTPNCLSGSSEGGRRIQVLKPRHSSVVALQSQSSSSSTLASSNTCEQHRSNSLPSTNSSGSKVSAVSNRLTNNESFANNINNNNNEEASTLSSNHTHSAIAQKQQQQHVSDSQQHLAKHSSSCAADKDANDDDSLIFDDHQRNSTTAQHNSSSVDNDDDDSNTHTTNEINDNQEAVAEMTAVEQQPRHNNHSAGELRSKSVACIKRAPASFPDEDEVSVVIITGCCSKIGCSMAVGFAKMGLRVALVDFDGAQISRVAQQCEAMSPKKTRRALQIVADISQLDQAHRVIDRTIQEFGRLDVLVNTVNNGGLIEASKKMQQSNGTVTVTDSSSSSSSSSSSEPTAETSPPHHTSGAVAADDEPHVFEQYHKIIATNMHAVTYLCISAAPYLRKTKGSILNVSQVTQNESGSSYKFAYCMSKAGIATLTKCLATDLAPDIKVICANPRSE